MSGEVVSCFREIEVSWTGRSNALLSIRIRRIS